MIQERFKDLTVEMVVEQWHKLGIDVCNATFTESAWFDIVGVFVDVDAVISVADLSTFDSLPSFIGCNFWLNRGYIRIRVSFDKSGLLSHLSANKELESSIS